MDIPITTRLKTAPKEKTALLQTTTTVPITGSTAGKDEITPGEEITGDKTWDDMRAEGASEEDIAKAKKWRKDNPKGERIQVGTGAYTPNVVVKGKGVDYDGTAKIETLGDVFQPWETRTQSRSIKKEGRDNRRSDIKKARNEAKGGGTFDEEGNYTEGTKLKGKAKREYIKKARQKAKAKETDFESKEFAAASVRNSKSRASGKKPGTPGVRTGERDMTMSELEKNADSVKVQDARLKKNAEIAAKRKAAAESQKITTSSTEEGEGNEVVSSYSQAANAVNPNTAIAMRKSGVGKMKATPYKMKGSMFNKNY
jgi:hypothetical protein